MRVELGVELGGAWWSLVKLGEIRVEAIAAGSMARGSGIFCRRAFSFYTQLLKLHQPQHSLALVSRSIIVAGFLRPARALVRVAVAALRELLPAQPARVRLLSCVSALVHR